jgi:hypothetical protein
MTRIAKLLTLHVATFALVTLAETAKSEPIEPANGTDGLTANAHINILGPLQFGLSPALEVGTAHVGITAQFRWLNSGLLARSILPTSSSQTLAFSYGIGAYGRYYRKPGLTGFNIGGGVEYLSVHVEDDRIQRERYLSGWVVPQIVGGYRWRFGNLLLGAGASLGYAVSVSAKTEDMSGGADPVLLPVDDTAKPYGSAALDLGFFF